MEIGRTISCVLVVVLIIVLAIEFRPHREYKGGHRRKAHSRARIINDAQIEITNLDDVNQREMDNWHVSMLKSRTRIGNGTWIYTFDKPMGPMGTRGEQEMYMREAEDSLNGFIDRYINPVKDEL